MASIRPEERWAAACISAALGGIPVRQFDDGSQPAMFDLLIEYRERPPAAVEVTAAADAQAIELWNLVNGSGDLWGEPDIAGGWFVGLSPDAKSRSVMAGLPPLLRRIEEAGIREVRGSKWASTRGPFDQEMSDLGVTWLDQSATDCPGSIDLTIDLPLEKSTAVLDRTGNALVAWLNGWIRQPERARKLEKLHRSGATERHLFVILPDFPDAPGDVAYLLMRDGAPVPATPPELPGEVTHLWIASTWRVGQGVRWDPVDGWGHFVKVDR